MKFSVKILLLLICLQLSVFRVAAISHQIPMALVSIGEIAQLHHAENLVMRIDRMIDHKKSNHHLHLSAVLACCLNLRAVNIIYRPFQILFHMWRFLY
jgi:hypothetical protein